MVGGLVVRTIVEIEVGKIQLSDTRHKIKKYFLGREAIPTYVLEVGCSRAISGKTAPDLSNENAPYLCLRLATLRFRLLLQLKHPFTERNKIRYEVGKRRGMRLSE